MNIVISGASGLIGTALVERLRASDHTVTRLVRREARQGEISWDPARGVLDASALEGTDAVIHLSGAGIGDKRWTPSYKREILESRTATTALLYLIIFGVLNFSFSMGVTGLPQKMTAFFQELNWAPIAVVGALLSNDAAALVLTPVAFVLAIRSGLHPLPFALACTFVADAVSIALPVSNPVNVIVTACGENASSRSPSNVVIVFTRLVFRDGNTMISSP